VSFSLPFSSQEFSGLVKACTPTMADSAVLSDMRLTALFEEAHTLEESAVPRGPPGDGAEDVLSPEAFAALCDRYGIVPFRRAGSMGSVTTGSLRTPGGISPAAGGSVSPKSGGFKAPPLTAEASVTGASEGSSPAGLGDEDEFAPVMRAPSNRGKGLRRASLSVPGTGEGDA
jgi:hypothetical protein